MEVACATDKEPEERQTKEKPADPVRSEMITADGTRTGSTVNVHNTNKRVKCVETPMDKTESVVSNITAGQGSKSSGKNIRKKQETLDANITRYYSV